MQVICSILLLCFAIWPGENSARPKSDSAIRAMTFNIRYNEPRDGVNAWPNRKSKVADVITKYRADLIGVQEAQFDQLKDLELLLPELAWVGVGRTDGKIGGEFSAILYKRSRFTLLDTNTFWLSEAPETPGSKGWDADYPRIVSWARFRDRVTKKTFYHFNTHFDHRGEKARVESSRLLLGRVRSIAGRSPFVVTGDFNARESTDVYKILVSGSPAKLVDTRYSSRSDHTGPASTFNEFKELVPEMKIDYIFVSEKTRVARHVAIDDRPGGLWPSDHLPVLAEIVF